MDRYVLTIGTQKKFYVDLAVNLALSFLHWHKNSNITFKLVTDQPQYIPVFLTDKIQVIKVKPGELGEGFSSKLYLDKLAAEGQTLFIDSDCLILGNLDWVFKRFENHAVSVIGNYISQGEWFGDVESICNSFNVTHIPKFNGGMYYLEKGLVATTVYNTARELEHDYDRIGFIKLRGKPNDEVLMALAMQLTSQQPVTDDGMIISDPLSCPGKYDVNVLTGYTLLTNPPAPNKLHRAWYPFEKVSPVVVHFLGDYTQHYQYQINILRLKRAFNNDSKLLTELAVFFKKYPEIIKNKLKEIFRPAFHTFIGVKKIKPSDRL